MVRQYKSKVSLNTLNSQRNYSFGFDYLNSTFIHVNLNGVELTQPRDFTVNEHEIILVNPPPSGGSLLIYRVTPSNRIVSWTDNSILKADNLNLSYIQLMHLAEEQMDNVRDETITRALDEAWDLKGSRIKRLGTPTDDMDAVPYGYVRHQKEEVEQLTAEVRQHKSTIEQAQRDVLSRQSAVDATEQRTNELAQRVTEQLNAGNTELTNKIIKAKNDIELLGSNTNTSIADKLSKATTTITQLGERTTNDVTSRINTAKSELAQQVTNVTNTIQSKLDTVNSSIETAKSDINNKVSTINREIDSRINNTTRDINDRINTAKQELATQATTLKEEIASNANSTTGALTTTIRMANEIREQIISASEKLKAGVVDEKTKNDIANALLSKQETLLSSKIDENNRNQATVQEAFINRKISENNTAQARINETLIASKINANNTTLKGEISNDVTSKISANNTTLKEEINNDVTSKINTNNSTLKNEMNNSIVSKISEHNTATTSHNLHKYMSMKPIPTGINNWNDFTDTGMYEATASMWGWSNAPSSTRVYYYGVVQVIKSDTNKITQVFYSYGANNKPCNICYRTFYNAWGTWHYHGDYDATVTDITKHTEGLNITKGDVTTVLKFLTTNKADTNTNLAPTLAVVKELLTTAGGNLNIQIEGSKTSGVYIVFGQGEKAIIIQIGTVLMTHSSGARPYRVMFPISFKSICFGVFYSHSKEDSSGLVASIQTTAIDKGSVEFTETVGTSNYRRKVYYIAIGI